jgi:hypothetical protein
MPTPTFEPDNPFVIGQPTAKDALDVPHNNTLALYDGQMSIGAVQAALDFVYASSSTQLARMAKSNGKYPRLNAAGSAWEWGTPVEGIHELYIPAAAMRPYPSGGPSTALTDYGTSLVSAWGFGATAVEQLIAQVALPKSWNNGTFTFQPYWMNRDGGSGDVVWDCGARAAGNDEDLGFSGISGQGSVDAAVTAHRLAIGPESAAITPANSPAAGDIVNLLIDRNGATGSDTYASTAYLIGIKLRITTSAANDA